MASEEDKPVPDTVRGNAAGPASAWEAAREYGIDMSLIEGNLRKKPAQRLADHAGVLNVIRALREAMRRQHGD